MHQWFMNTDILRLWVRLTSRAYSSMCRERDWLSTSSVAFSDPVSINLFYTLFSFSLSEDFLLYKEFVVRRCVPVCSRLSRFSMNHNSTLRYCWLLRCLVLAEAQGSGSSAKMTKTWEVAFDLRRKLLFPGIFSLCLLHQAAEPWIRACLPSPNQKANRTCHCRSSFCPTSTHHREKHPSSGPALTPKRDRAHTAHTIFRAVDRLSHSCLVAVMTPPTTNSSTGASPDNGQYRVVRKRNRIPLSCGPCRHRK
jgi:hypothetical protein